MAKLMKPLFVNGMFNKDGKRIRVNYLKTVGKYPLWIKDGNPDKYYSKNLQDKYYIYIQIGEYIFTAGETEHDIIQRAGFEKLNKEWYGSFKERQKYFEENFYKNKTFGEYNPLVKKQCEKEEEFVIKYGQEEYVQAEYLQKGINRCVQRWIDARDNDGGFADFIGALYLNELDKCQDVSKELKAKRQEKERIKKEEFTKRKIKEAEEAKKAEEENIEEAERIFLNGGTIEDSYVIIKLANKYNIDIPIRTKGWILNSLAEITVVENGSMNYKYWKRSINAKGSQKIYDILSDIYTAISQNKTVFYL